MASFIGWNHNLRHYTMLPEDEVIPHQVYVDRLSGLSIPCELCGYISSEYHIVYQCSCCWKYYHERCIHRLRTDEARDNGRLLTFGCPHNGVPWKLTTASPGVTNSYGIWSHEESIAVDAEAEEKGENEVLHEEEDDDDDDAEDENDDDNEEDDDNENQGNDDEESEEETEEDSEESDDKDDEDYKPGAEAGRHHHRPSLTRKSRSGRYSFRVDKATKQIICSFNLPSTGQPCGHRSSSRQQQYRHHQRLHEAHYFPALDQATINGLLSAISERSACARVLPSTSSCKTAMEAHKVAVDALAAQVKQFHARQEPFRIYHGSTNSTRQSQHNSRNTISTAHLNNVLDVNEATETVTVEPNVPMDALVAATLQHGLVPLVVMEFPGITAGGGFSGTSGESSSFRHGFFDATVQQIEIVIPNGEIRRASRTTDPDLFWGAASAFGTLGVVTLLEIQCRRARPFVELSYIPTTSMAEAMKAIRAATADPSTEYLDGIVFAKDHIVICAGKLTDELPGLPQQRFTRPHDPWFYLHAQTRAPPPSGSASIPPQTPPKDLIPLQDYLFRYDRGAFWTGRYAYAYFLTPFNRVTRYLLDSFMHTRVMYHALHQSGLAAQHVIQDVAVPYAATTRFLDWLDEPQNFGAYPIWLCPLLRKSEQGGLLQGQVPTPSQSQSPEAGAYPQGKHAPPNPQENPQAKEKEKDENYLMNFGLWAPSPHRGGAFIAQNRALEGKVQSLGGKKWLYAHAYYTEHEFWEIYDRRRYDALRERYHAAYLPDLFEKVRVNLDALDVLKKEGWGPYLRRKAWGVWPFSGLYGVWRAWCRGEYYLSG
ncbi:FAD-binding oxidoreductase [Aspergillus homomorphus CBS 101889]|uniref:Delta(24)-sterol reductase n=1 Tax=Aspergillus homomorphus (strain CBS 101889) TaxID=1450537 RepID=A0A395I054_ASPHC|nr:hypothetical protein BO97DRAFT_443112 [Aspergillus homomorphus CBS 101889]RAL12508.1 hypothetical protein BO97DRAFT_443112 [Aspergillus homomorphus CBS 101889]